MESQNQQSLVVKHLDKDECNHLEAQFDYKLCEMDSSKKETDKNLVRKDMINKGDKSREMENSNDQSRSDDVVNEITEITNAVESDSRQISVEKLDLRITTNNIKRTEDTDFKLENNIHENNSAENSVPANEHTNTVLSGEENSDLLQQETSLLSNYKGINDGSDATDNLNINIDFNEDEESEEIQLNEECDEAISASQESLSVIKDDKFSDSSVNSEDTRTNDEDIDVNINSNSQFYEGSDSKLDYAVKLDDNDNDTLSDIEDIKTDSAVDSEDSALGSLPPDGALNEREEEGQDRSDGSDSGLGSETTEDGKISNFGIELPSTSGLNTNERTIDIHMNEVPTDDPKNKDQADSTITIPTNPKRSSLKRRCENDSAEEPQVKKKKEGIRFDKVTVFYFPRAQGFNCVPSQGGSTLGMERQHSHMQNFTLTEHAIEQRRLHRQILQQLKNERHSLQGASLSSSEESDTEEEASDLSESELDLDSYYFLQPVPTRQRRALLRNAGVRKIEAYEKDECRDIRTSREFCGCACKGSCNPETCSCSLAGIKCQVDRLNFPCGCSRECCKNTTGRIEFNPIRVRTHFIHTLMRIGLEKKNEEEAAKRQWAETARAATASCAVNTCFETNRCYNHEDGLVKDVSLSPRVEVESCVNAGSFSNVHLVMNNTSPAGNIMQEGMSYSYQAGASHGSVNNQTVMQITETGQSHLADPYSASMLQGKPPYPIANNMGFDTMQQNIQRFPCDINYSYGTHENQHFKSLQSFSASSFEEFAHAHNSHMAMFGNYGHYSQDYMHKQNTAHPLQYHHMPQNHYDMYKTTETGENKDSYYAPLMSLPYHSNKMQSVDDENWFSRNTLMAVEEQTQEALELPAPPGAPAPTAAPAPAPAPVPAAADATGDTNSEVIENFGELIKKTMVESVSV